MLVEERLHPKRTTNAESGIAALPNRAGEKNGRCATPLYDYQCQRCETEEEIFAPMAERHAQSCERCGEPLRLILRPTPHYDPTQQDTYYDEGLGVEITGRDHRRRVMRDLKCDHRERPRPGDMSARADRCNELRKERARA